MHFGRAKIALYCHITSAVMIIYLSAIIASEGFIRTFSLFLRKISPVMTTEPQSLKQLTTDAKISGIFSQTVSNFCEF